MVVDRNASPGMGSTSRANGGVRAQFTTPINIVFSQFTITKLRELHELSGGVVGFRPVGYLFLTGTDAGEIALRRSFELQRSLGVDVQWLSAHDVIEKVPFVNVDGLSGATFCADDGIIDPHGVVSALWAECRRLDIAFLFDTEVLGVGGGSPHECAPRPAMSRPSSSSTPPVHLRRALRRWQASTYRSSLAGETWRAPNRSAGIADAIPMCVDNDTGVLIRREGAGFLIGFSDPADLPSTDTGFDPAFLDAIAARVGNRFPFLEDVPISPRKCWAGLYPETPDHHAIIDVTNRCSMVHSVRRFRRARHHALVCGGTGRDRVDHQRCIDDVRPGIHCVCLVLPMPGRSSRRRCFRRRAPPLSRPPGPRSSRQAPVAERRPG